MHRIVSVCLSVVAVFVVCSLLVQNSPVPARGQENRLVVISFGGNWERDTRAALIDAFEKGYGTKVDYIRGNSIDIIARLKAERDNPQIDVAMLDDFVAAEAALDGLFQKLDPTETPNLKLVRPEARFIQDLGVGWTASATVLMYNTDKVQPAPTSWKLLWDPRYKGHVALPTVALTNGIHTLLIASRVWSGNEFNTDMGIAALHRMVTDNGAVVYTDITQMNTLAQQGQIWLAPFSNFWINKLQDGGTHVAIAVPQEGVYPYWTIWSLVKGAKHSDLAKKFINFALRREVEERFVARANVMPSDTSVYVNPDIAKRIIFSPLLKMDYATVAKNRSGWIDKWNRAMVGK